MQPTLGGGLGNMFLLGGVAGPSNVMMMGSSTANNNNSSSAKPQTSAAAIVRMISDDDSDSTDAGGGRKRSSKEKKDRKDRDRKDKDRRRHRSSSVSSASSAGGARRDKDKKAASSSSAAADTKPAKKPSADSDSDLENLATIVADNDGPSHHPHRATAHHHHGGGGAKDTGKHRSDKDKDKGALTASMGGWTDLGDNSAANTNNGLLPVRGGATPTWRFLPPHALQLAYLKREKAGLFSSKGDTFAFFLEPSRRFVLAARRRARKSTPNYLISLDAADLERDSDKFHGKVRANYSSTEYVFYDAGVSPEEYMKAAAKMGGGGNGANAALLPRIRREIGAAIFENPNAPAGGGNGGSTSVIGSAAASVFKSSGTSQPRRLIVLLPAFNPSTGESTVDWCQHVGGSEFAGGSTQKFNNQSSNEDKKKDKDKKDGKKDKKDKKRKGSDSSDEDSDDAREAANPPPPAAPGADGGSYGAGFSLLIQAYVAAQKRAAIPSANGAASPSSPHHPPAYPDDIIVLNNKAPQWNEAAKSFQLNFKGRVGQSSIKNFQLVQVSDGGMSRRFPNQFAASPNPADSASSGGAASPGGGSGDGPGSPNPLRSGDEPVTAYMDGSGRRGGRQPAPVRQSMDPERLRAEMSGLPFRGGDGSGAQQQQRSPSSDSDTSADGGSSRRRKDKKDKKRRGGARSDRSDSSDVDSDSSDNRKRRGKKDERKTGGFFSSSPNGGGDGASSCPTGRLCTPDPERVVMQFGRRDDKTFSLDFMAPINAQQALCIALTSFDVKMGIE